jgi:serine protease Do
MARQSVSALFVRNEENTMLENVISNGLENQGSTTVRQKRHRMFARIAVACLLSGMVGSGITAFTMQGAYLRIPVQSDVPGTVSAASYFPSVSLTSLTAPLSTALTIDEISDMVSPAVVSITATAAISDRFGRTSTSTGGGSGVIISDDGYILTNNHVVDGASALTVKMSTGTEYAAKLIGKDSQTDLAVLKVGATDLPFAEFGDSDALKVGELAVAIGNPLGELAGTVTAGIISATDREITIDGERMNLLQTDAAINPGNSGGALCNAYGEVIGIVNAKSSALGIEGLGFAIPANDAKPIMEQLISNGYVSGRVAFGVSLQEVTKQTARFFRATAGVYVSDVTSGGAAEAAGIKRGDRIVSIDGAEVTLAVDLKEIIESHSVGDKVTVTLDRDGGASTVVVTLTEVSA